MPSTQDFTFEEITFLMISSHIAIKTSQYKTVKRNVYRPIYSENPQVSGWMCHLLKLIQMRTVIHNNINVKNLSV